MKYLKYFLWFLVGFYMLAFTAQLLSAHEPERIMPGSHYKLTQHIKFNEGFRTNVYEDTRGNLTVGYGHKLDKKRYYVGQPIDTETLSRWFRGDLNTAKRCARRFLKNDYVENEFIVITDMAFNLGCTKLYSFQKLRKHINNHDYVMAQKAIRGSIYYNQVTNRAIRNIRLLNK